MGNLIMKRSFFIRAINYFMPEQGATDFVKNKKDLVFASDKSPELQQNQPANMF